MADERSELRRSARRRTILFMPGLGLMLFAPAGSLRYWQGWLFAIVFIASSSAIGVYFSKHDPKLLERRMKAGPAAEKETSQKLIIFLVLVAFALLIMVPGLDYRWHWSYVPTSLVLVANGAVASSFVIFFWVLKQNSYAASTVTVEPGQPVVSTGLYGVVRHPMYAGALLLIGATPLALGSYWDLFVAVAALPALIWRLLDEERILTRDLPGYANYCRRVRYRLIPGVW